MAQWASFDLLISELKEHEKFEENVDSLISKLRQKGLLHEDVSGSTVSETAEMLATYLNHKVSSSCSESFCTDLLEVLQSYPAFEDMAMKFRSDTQLKISSEVLTLAVSGGNVLDSKQKNDPKVVDHLFENLTKVSSSIYGFKLHMTAITEKLGFNKNVTIEASEYAGRYINTAKLQHIPANRPDKVKDRRMLEEDATAEEKIFTLQTRMDEVESEKGTLQMKVKKIESEKEALQKRVNELEQFLESEKESVQELKKRVSELDLEKEQLQMRCSDLDLERSALLKTVDELQLKTESCSPATCPIRPLKLFCKDVKPTGKKPLGSGCYGSVVEVKYRGAIYAAKKFRGDLEITNFEEKLNTEFGILLQLEHDHIVCYIGFTRWQDSEFPVLLMEKLAISLHAHLEHKFEYEHIIPLAEKLHILLGVGKGLRYLHEKHVIHRDLTARNVLLDQSNPPISKIADFGNSHITSTNPISECDSSFGLPGTQLYMPPEAGRSSGRRSHKLDIFSFGHLSLFVCTQKFPKNLLDSTYTSKCEDGTEELRGRSEVDRRRTYFAKLDDEQYRPLKALMYKCLDNDPAKRPPASEVVCELNEIHSPPECSDNVDNPMDGDDYDMPSRESNDSSLGIN